MKQIHKLLLTGLLALAALLLAGLGSFAPAQSDGNEHPAPGTQRGRQGRGETRSERDGLRVEHQDRKSIDRAKGLLIQRQGLNEQAAYEKLRKTAMDRNLKLVDVAQRMLDVMDLLS